MLLIECPFCGPRDEDEFRCGGESHIERPVPAETVDDARWGDYLHNRANPRGLNFERWWHSAGCSQWFNIARDTFTHRIVAVYRMGSTPPLELAQSVERAGSQITEITRSVEPAGTAQTAQLAP